MTTNIQYSLVEDQDWADFAYTQPLAHFSGASVPGKLKGVQYSMSFRNHRSESGTTLSSPKLKEIVPIVQ